MNIELKESIKFDAMQSSINYSLTALTVGAKLK